MAQKVAVGHGLSGVIEWSKPNPCASDERRDGVSPLSETHPVFPIIDSIRVIAVVVKAIEVNNLDMVRMQMQRM